MSTAPKPANMLNTMQNKQWNSKFSGKTKNGNAKNKNRNTVLHETLFDMRHDLSKKKSFAIYASTAWVLARAVNDYEPL